MKKNTCPHCGAWGQLSKFCQRCGASIVYQSVKEGTKTFEGKQIANSTQGKDMSLSILFSILLTIGLFTIFVLIFSSLVN